MKRTRIQLGMMKWWRHGALVLALAASAVAGPIVDRVVTSVNGHVLLQSDWEQEVAFEALSNGRDPDSFTSAEREAALNRLSIRSCCGNRCVRRSRRPRTR